MSGIPKDKKVISNIKLPPSAGRFTKAFNLAHKEKTKTPERIIFGFADNKKEKVLIEIVKQSLNDYYKDDEKEVKEIWEEFKAAVLKFEKESEGNVVQINSKELHELIDIFLAGVENFQLIMQETLKKSQLMLTLVQTYMKYEEENYPEKK